MTTLPASVRIALWVTAAWAADTDPRAPLSKAMHDVDDLTGALDRFDLWRSFGESVVLVALPHPGALGPLPRSSDGLLGAAIDAGECAFVPALGGAVVPTHTRYGTPGDEGWQLTLTAYDSDPVPLHRIEMLSLPEIERRLQSEIRSATEQLEAIDAPPWESSGREVRWESAVPPQVPGRIVQVMRVAATISDAAYDGAAASTGSSAYEASARLEILRRLTVACDGVLADVTNVAALQLAGVHQRSRP